MKAPPAFQFYASDFVAGTMSFTAEETGAYILLLCYQWMSGSLPDDDLALARIGRCSVLALAVLRKKFQPAQDGSGLQNPRLEKVRQDFLAFSQKQAENGRKGGAALRRRLSQCPGQIEAPLHSGQGVGETLLSPISISTDIVSKETKGKGETEQRSTIPASSVLPLMLCTPEFRAAWAVWLDHLKQKKKPATLHAQDLQLAKLSKLGVAKAIETIHHSIEHNWQGLWENDAPAAGPAAPKKMTDAEALKWAMS